MVKILHQVLTKAKRHVVLPKKFLDDAPFVFNFTKANKILSNLSLRESAGLSLYITQTMKKAEQVLGVGRYGEDRTIYKSPLYTRDGEARSIHLGVDLFVPPGTPIFAPLDAIIHSFQDNNRLLDYGPTIILEHNLEGIKFYTLYGHLTRSSLDRLIIDQKIIAGEQIALVGKQEENGGWPPHLHFQIITDLLGFKGDFPGVARPSEKDYYLNLCPDPNLILQLPT